MAKYLFQFRELHHALVSDEVTEVAPLLARWAEANRAILAPFGQFQKLNAVGNDYEVERDDLESLNALNVVCDTLLLPFQTGECWFDLSCAQFADFWETLGIEAREVAEYHPFWCEIVACENGADDDAPPIVEEQFWPALTWGELLICRAGVRVRAGKNWMNAAVAAHSPLYFASRRSYRKSHDLSHGWGGNSQWRTKFRRDYVWNEHYIFNADGKFDGDSALLQNLSAHQWVELLKIPRQIFSSGNGDNSDLTPTEREELLVNRCLIHNAKTYMDDFWPYDDVAVWKQSRLL